MPTAKLELFDKDLQSSALLFKALGHPARLAILNFLAETNTCFTGDISNELPLGRTTINQHLAELKKAGLIQGHISGIKTNYCLDQEVILKLKQRMEKLITNMKCC
ncbi:MAG: metalloregulator ArsR/SmtB family transcription factor [Bacteroidales bacterium]|nr:metalloregulator ArsR/SmtB family transcription factor [Bacteroidales bacterium]MCF8405793.1 metalloregulator ArsR/SmtB family transcription factor [Bacteroidales bacterium]